MEVPRGLAAPTPPRWMRHRESESDVMPGIKWGRPDVLFTPAYWRHQADALSDRIDTTTHRLGTSLKSECVACILGGHGIPAEIGLAAFDALVSQGLLETPHVSQSEVFKILSQPLQMADGRVARYRFANQKSACVWELLNTFTSPPFDDRIAIRNWLTGFRGIGLKTASWIVRNWYSSDDVAILDIHIHRAGLLIGIFEPSLTISRHYLQLERQFLDFAVALGVRASLLDAIIWQQMKRAGSLVHRLLS